MLKLYLDELDRWNQRINLTSVPRADFWRRHVGESLALLETAAPEAGCRVVDVGSGAGVPGVVVAVVRPDMQVVMLEADKRKAAFLMHVAGMLGLGNATVAAVRAEAAGRDPSMRESFDLALSRAAAPPELLLELALPLLRVGGRLLALVADAPAAALGCRAVAMKLGGLAPRAVGAGTLVVYKEETR